MHLARLPYSDYLTALQLNPSRARRVTPATGTGLSVEEATQHDNLAVDVSEHGYPVLKLYLPSAR